MHSLSYNWLEFDICIKTMHLEFKASLVGDYAGLLTLDEHFEVNFNSQPLQADIDYISSYLAGLTEQGELDKIYYYRDLPSALKWYSEQAAAEGISSLSELQRKVLFRLELTEAESFNIYDQWKSTQG